MKFNRSEIMRNAWNLVRTAHVTMSVALKSAWATAKALITAEELRSDCEGHYCGHSKVIVNDWIKYGKNRTYITVRVYTNAWNIKHEFRLGYIDNMIGAFVAA